MPPPLILASTSTYRRALLERLGIPFTCLPPACDEEALKDPALDPQALSDRLAEAKARSLQADHPQAVIIGSDQVLSFQGSILGKPGTPERAQQQLERLSGQVHQLVTAMVVLHLGQAHRQLEVAEMAMRPLDSAAIKRYIERDAPLDCAGSYKLEAGGIALFSRVTCADHSAITGLPLLGLVRILSSLGWSVP